MSLSTTESTTPLEHSWCLWFHHTTDYKWDLESYRSIITLRSIEDFWSLYNEWNQYLPEIQNNMFFLMKQGIPPIWEDEKNQMGGVWCFRVQKMNVYSAWTELSMMLLGNTLCKDVKHMKHINGISISSKTHYSIIKIWNNDSSLNDVSILETIPFINFEKGIFKNHIDNIKYDKEKKTTND